MRHVLVLLALAGVAQANANDKRFDKTAEDLEAMLAQYTAKGHKPVGPLQKGQLEAFQPLTVELKRGFCYIMLLRLGDGAVWSEHARHGVVFLYKPIGGDGFEVNGGPGIAGPGGMGSAGCPQSTTKYVFDVWANWGSAMSKARVHDLGTGPYTLQLYAKPVSNEKLAAQKADTERQIHESEEWQRQRARNTCVTCSRQKDDCFDGRHRPFGGSCGDEYRSCLFRSGIREADCYMR
jgi:hypothetical protein